MGPTEFDLTSDEFLNGPDSAVAKARMRVENARADLARAQLAVKQAQAVAARARVALAEARAALEDAGAVVVASKTAKLARLQFIDGSLPAGLRSLASGGQAAHD